MALNDFSPCELADALVKLGVPNGGHLPDISPVSSGSISGPAYTVRMVPAHDTTAPTPTVHFVDAAPAGSIVVIDAPLQAKNAVWGGLMSAGAIARSVVGVVISGRCRDIEEHQSLHFPVFARGRSTLGQSTFTRPSELNVPLLIGTGDPNDDAFTVKVEPGDWIAADVNGVVCVPRRLEQLVVELASKGRQVDALCMKDIKSGKGIQASFKLHRGK